MIHTDASVSLKGYKEWLNSLNPVPTETIFKIMVQFNDFSIGGTTIKTGEYLKVVEIRGVGKSHTKIYKLVVCNKNGSPFTKVRFQYVNVEIVARKLHYNEWIIQNVNEH